MIKVSRSQQKGIEYYRHRPDININSINISATVRQQKLAKISRNWQKKIKYYRCHSDINVNNTDISATVNVNISANTKSRNRKAAKSQYI